MLPFRKLAVCGVAMALISTSIAGCADNESSMFVIGVLDLTDSECKLTPDPGGPFLLLGRLDLAVRSSYSAPILVGNQLTERGSRNQLRTETSRVRLEGADIIIETVGGGSVAEFSTIGTGFVHPASGTEPSYGGLYADLVPPTLAIGEGDYVARIKAYGTTLGGQEIESGELRFPIQVCYGCLIDYSGAALDVNVAAGMPYLCATTESQAADPVNIGGNEGCFIGQDYPVSCTRCSATLDLCRDPSLNPYGG